MKKHYIGAGVFAALFVILLACVKCADVAAIGPAGTSIGLAGINGAARTAIGLNLSLREISEWLGKLAIALVLAFVCVGLVQFIRRKSLKKVDRELLALGCLYAALACCYIFFEKVIINYRPVILPGEAAPEASFPSSHAMLACVIFGSAALLAGRYVKDRTLRLLLMLLCVLLAAAAVLLRLFSGVHWLTDILAGVLLGAALLELYAAAIGKEKKS